MTPREEVEAALGTAWEEIDTVSWKGYDAVVPHLRALIELGVRLAIRAFNEEADANCGRGCGSDFSKLTPAAVLEGDSK